MNTSLLATFAGLSAVGAASAQQGPSAEGAKTDVIIVTGSRIARQDYVANSPIVTVGQDEIAATGTTTLDTLLNEMPQFVPQANMTSNNPSNGGQANLQLRGLGTNRTLVLMNGHRVVPSNNDGTVDINVIPAQLVQSIEVITGGASATYGSDAIAGVVNFKLREDFQGFEVSGTYGITDRDDGETESISLAAGDKFADGRGHAMLSLSYDNRAQIYNSARPASSISGASAATPLGNTIFDSNNLPSQAALNTAIGGTAAAAADTYGFNNDGTLFDYVNRNNFKSPGGITYDGFHQPGPFFNPSFAFNTGALNDLTVPQTRYNAFAAVDYTINDHVQFYGNFLFTQYDSSTELAASPASSTTTGFRVPVSNPFIPASLRAVLASRPLPLGSFRLDKRFVALGARHQEELYDVYQITSGFRGDIGLGDWTYDAYGSYGRVDRTSIQTGNVSRSAVQSLLNATDGGNSICAGGFNWYGETSLSDACKTYIGRTSKNLVTVEQRNVEISAQGGLFKLPAGDVRLAVGVDYREDSYNRIPDGSLTAAFTVQPCIATVAYNGTAGSGVCAGSATSATGATGNPALIGGDIAGFNPSSAITGDIDTKEVFVEALIPILKDLPGVKEFNLTLGGRQGDYSTVGDVSTYKADLDWTIIDGLRVRGGYERAIRAPAIGELFAPALLGFPSIGNPQTSALAPQKSGDPCDIRGGYRSTAGTNLAASTNAQVRALCVAQGVSAGTVDSYTYTNQQVPAISGGNPNLNEETAKTWSAGVVWTPHLTIPFLENISASVDYYNIQLQDAIGSIDANTLITGCFNSNGTSNPTYSPTNGFCALLQRDPLSGNIINARSDLQNIANAETAGVDFQVDWSHEVGPGKLSASMVGSYLEKFTEVPAPGQILDRKGKISNTGSLGSTLGGSYPEWKFLTTVNYEWGPVKAGIRWQHIDEMTNFNNKADSIPAIGYFDLIGQWKITDWATLRATVNNVMDELPPTYTPSVQGNTDPSTYDVLGRRYTIGLMLKY